jgi:nickel/cobalt transporter (NicO) family protein
MRLASESRSRSVARCVAALALVVAMLGAARVSAHPLGNFTINHLTKASIRADDLTLKYVLDIAEIPTFQIMRERGIDGPQRVARLERWSADEVALVTGGLQVTVDGVALRLIPGAPYAATRPGAGGLPTLYWVEEFRTALPPGNGARHLEIRDVVYPGRIGWRDIVVSPEQEPTKELRSYPSALIGSPRHVEGVRLTLAADARVLARATIDEAESTPAGSTSQIRSNALSDMLAKGVSNPWLVLLTLIMATGLGALHALEPGHGKTLLAVSLVGARATSKQALILAIGLTFAHTAGVLALGVLMLAAAQWIVPENVYPWITLASGMMVAVLGANALSRYIKTRRGQAHAHIDGRMDSSIAGEAHDHEHDHGDHQHVPSGSAPLSFGSVVLIAMSGNVAPCPAALVVLLAALTLHQLGYGLLVIVAFSVGLASVLTGLGIALVHGATWLSNRPSFEKAVRYGPPVSATVIAGIGAVMLGQGASASTLHAPALVVTTLVLAAIAGYAFAPGHQHAHVHANRHAHRRAPAFERNAS